MRLKAWRAGSSSEATGKFSVAADFPEIHHLDFPDPIGKGGALIEGLKLAPLGDLIAYVDADGDDAPAQGLRM